MINRDTHGDRPYAVLTPDGRAPGETLPLILVLHGANSSSELLAGMQPMVEGMWADGSLPQSILACVSTPTVGGFYIGHWERLVAVEFQQMISRRYDADPARVALMGSSMGGYGALKIAFADPSRWAAVAATAPAVLPADPPPRNTIGVLAQLAAEMGAAGFEANSVLHRLHANASAVRDSGLPIFLRVGDRDLFNMHDGTEQLHRALWDLDIGHDYHLVFGGDHVGPEAPTSGRKRPPPSAPRSPSSGRHCGHSRPIRSGVRRGFSGPRRVGTGPLRASTRPARPRPRPCASSSGPSWPTLRCATRRPCAATASWADQLIS